MSVGRERPGTREETSQALWTAHTQLKSVCRVTYHCIPGPPIQRSEGLHGFKESAGSFSLCGFCDASTTAYAAIVYLVARTEMCVQSQFVAFKTRVASLQTLSIPRLHCCLQD